MANFRSRQRKRSRAPIKRSRIPTNESWEAFVEWCQSRGLNPVPANPWSVAAYARSMEGKYKPSAIRKCVTELARIHTEKTRKRLAHHPMVLRTLDIIERRADPDKRDSGLFTDELLPTSNKTKTSQQQKASTSKTKPKKSLAPGWSGLNSQPRLVPRRSLKH